MRAACRITVAILGAACLSSLTLGAVVAAPAEAPPAGYAGNVYVDSEGCMFIRAGTAARVVWVPRVNRSGMPLCGYAPSARTAGGGTEARTAAPVPKAQPVIVARAKPAAPWPPKGYETAWTDGRLNPERGPRTQTGDLAMAARWSDSVPMRRKAAESAAPAGTIPVIATKSVAPGAAFVQVGVFGVAQNATRAVDGLLALGLPVTIREVQKQGRTLSLVMAGPFGDGAEAAHALRAARQGGFADAFLR